MARYQNFKTEEVGKSISDILKENGMSPSTRLWRDKENKQHRIKGAFYNHLGATHVSTEEVPSHFPNRVKGASTSRASPQPSPVVKNADSLDTNDIIADFKKIKFEKLRTKK